MAIPCASSCSAAVTTSSTDLLWPRWITSAPMLIRMRRMMLMAASWPSNSDAAVTKRTLLVGRYSVRAFCSAERSVMASLSERVDQLGHRSEQVGFEPIVGHREDRRLRVLVDRDDDLAVLHPRQMLDRTRDAGGDVQLRRDDLAGLSDLPVVRRITRIDGGAARTERGAEFVRQWRQHLVELVGRAEGPPAGDDDLRGGQPGPVVLR